MSSNPNAWIFCVFPYLKTHRRIRLRGVEYRSNSDLDDLDTIPRDHLKTLCSMFFIGDNVRIREMTCACIHTGGDSARHYDALQVAYETQLLIGYLYSSPHPSGGVFLPAESATLFVFRPYAVSSYLVRHRVGEDERVTILGETQESEPRMLDGYEGIRNDTVHLWVAEGSRIYPEIPHQTLNISQNLDSDVEIFTFTESNWALRKLYTDPGPRRRSDVARDRVFSSLEWYLRSCRESIDETEKLVHLAIALESLLRVPSGERLTERFKDAVLTLIGPVARLDSWLDQFYTARSKAVHEGVPHQLMFLAADQEQVKRRSPQSGGGHLPHRSLLEYGRRIFRLCLTNLVSAAENADAISLDKLFVHNSERLKLIFKILTQKAKPADVRLREVDPIVDELNEYKGTLNEPHVEIDEVFGAARLMLDLFTSSGPTLTDEAKDAIVALQGDAVKTAKDSERLAALRLVMESLQRIDGTRIGSHDVIIQFLSYATSHVFSLRSLYRESER